MQDQRWVPIYISKDIFEATMIKQVLDNNGFTTFELNQQNAAYGAVLGEIKILIYADEFIRAKRVLEKVLDA